MKNSSGPAQVALTCGSVIHARKLVTTAKCSTFELISYEFILSKHLIFTFFTKFEIIKETLIR